MAIPSRVGQPQRRDDTDSAQPEHEGKKPLSDRRSDDGEVDKVEKRPSDDHEGLQEEKCARAGEVEIGACERPDRREC